MLCVIMSVFSSYEKINLPIEIKCELNHMNQDHTALFLRAEGGEFKKKFFLKNEVRVFIDKSCLFLVVYKPEFISLCKTYCSTIQNSLRGFEGGFKIYMELRGLGYRMKVQGPKLELFLGYSHSISVVLPGSIGVSVLGSKARVLELSGKDLPELSQ